MSFKKVFSCIVIVALLCSMLCVEMTCVDDSDSRVFYAPMLPDSYEITVDGNMDTIWYACEAQPIERVDLTGSNLQETETRGTLRIMWDSEGFYVYIEVDKSGDATEVYNGSGEGDLYWENVEYTNDCVRMGWITNSNNNWTSVGDSTVAFNGGATPLLNGSKNLGGWFYWYGGGSCDAVMKQIDDYKYSVEAWVSWVRPNDTSVYGAGGVQEGTVFLFDAAITAHDGTGERQNYETNATTGEYLSRYAVITWNSNPYDNFSSGTNLGYVMLSAEADLSNLPISAGDCNADNEIDIRDATLLLKHLAEWDVEIESFAADCNADNEIDIRDATLLLKYLAEWDVTLG